MFTQIGGEKMSLFEIIILIILSPIILISAVISITILFCALYSLIELLSEGLANIK